MPDSSPETKPPAARNPFFAMVIFSTTLFVLTILAMVAVTFGDPRAPVARFIDQHAGRLIAAEVVVTLVSGILAMTVDRVQSRRSRKTLNQSTE